MFFIVLRSKVMRFFKFQINLFAEQFADITGKFRGEQRIIDYQLIVDTFEEFNQTIKNTGFIFPFCLTENKFGFGMIITGNANEGVMMQKLMEKLNIRPDLPLHTEVTFREFFNMLRLACKNHFVEDDEEIVERFGLDIFRDFLYSSILTGEEELITFATKEELLKKSDEVYGGNSLKEEIKRIFSIEPCSIFMGHPVHYLIQNNDKETRKKYVYLLLQALYCQNRIISRRFSVLNLYEDRLEKNILEKVYKSNYGGCVILNVARASGDMGEFACASRDSISSVCELMKKYRNSVLSIILLPLDDGFVASLFHEYSNNLRILNIREYFNNNVVACSYLEQLAINSGIKPDVEFLDEIKPDISYYAFEVKKIFEDWYNKKLCESVFPAYNEIKIVEKKLDDNSMKSCALDILNSMIGLSGVKEKINSILDFSKAQKFYVARGLRNKKPAMHMSFTGNPGTAKTTVARLFARIMKENYIIDTGKFVEVGRKDLVGKFVGWTAKIVEQKFKEASGGVLFIDEAYSLVDDKNGLFGDEAINTIVQEMENHRDDVVVIFAGYPDRMETFIQRNEGLRSRISHHVAFKDYSVEELCQIAELIAGKENFKLTAAARRKLYNIFETASRNKDFGNGRFARNIIENAKMLHARAVCKLDSKKITNKKLLNLTASDIESPDNKYTEARPRIGFACC